MSFIIDKFHQLTGIAHDTIWDGQGWFMDLLGWTTKKLKHSWKELTSGFNRWLPLHLVATLLWLVPLAATTLLAGLATTVAFTLSFTIDTLKLTAYLVDRLAYGAYRLLKGGLSLLRKLFGSKKENQPQRPEVTDPQASKTPSEPVLEAEAKPSIYEQDWYKIIEYARWAPSPHNMQPWLFDLESATQASLMYDPQRLLPDTNPEGSYMFVGFGILFETMSIAAAQLGKDVEVEISDKVELDSKKSGLQKLAALKIVDRKVEKAESLDPQLILERRTSRLPYNGKELDETVLNELSAVARQYGHTMGYSNDYKMVDWIIQLNAKAMHSDMSNRRTRNELRSWFRYSKTEAEKRADGLAAYAMNSSALELWLFANVNWLFRIPGISHLARKFYIKSMSGTATVTWLSGPFSNQDDWVKAGRMMARWWLTMAKHKIYIHPFGSVITNPEAFASMNDKIKTETKDERSAADRKKNPIWMLTRNGYIQPDQEPPQAQRRPLEKMIVSSHQCSLFKTPPETKETTSSAGRSPAPLR